MNCGCSDLNGRKTKLLTEGLPLFFSLMFGLRSGWVGQQKSEHRSNLENGAEKWTLPYKAIVKSECLWEKEFPF